MVYEYFDTENMQLGERTHKILFLMLKPTFEDPENLVNPYYNDQFWVEKEKCGLEGYQEVEGLSGLSFTIFGNANFEVKWDT